MIKNTKFNEKFSEKFSNFSDRYINDVTLLFPAKQYITLAIMVVLTSLLSACQLTPIEETEIPEKKVTSINYSQYYLWLKSLDNAQIIAEEVKQQSIMKNQADEKIMSQGKLILIYCLPKTSIHHPYRAKRLLNELLLVSNTMTKDNLAFTMLLRDQLNSQLFLLQKQDRLEKSFNKLNDDSHATIESLEEQLNHVNQQLMLLKQIDQNINQRG